MRRIMGLCAVAAAALIGLAGATPAAGSTQKCTNSAPHACDEVRAVYSGNMQSNTSSAGRAKDVSVSWSISFQGTLEDLGAGRVLPKIDSLTGTEMWNYPDTGGECQTGLTLNRAYNTQQMIGITSPGTMYVGPLQNVGYQDSPKRKGYLVEGNISLRWQAGDNRGLAVPSNPDVKNGCDLFAPDGPVNEPEATKFTNAFRPYAIFSADGTPDVSTPATTSINWNETDASGGTTRGQFSEQLTFKTQPAAATTKHKTKRNHKATSNSTTTTAANRRVP
jgi:hypothetical protein